MPGVIGNFVLNPLKLRAGVEQQTERNVIVQLVPMCFNRNQLLLIKRGIKVARLHARFDHQKDAVVRKLRERDDLARLAHIGHKVRHGMLTSIAYVAPKDRVALLGSSGIELQLKLRYGNVSQATRLVMLRLHGRPLHHLQADCSIRCHIREGEHHPLVIDCLLAELQRRLIGQNIDDQQALRSNFLGLALKRSASVVSPPLLL